MSPSRGRGPGCCPRWSQQSGAACRPQCSSTAGPSSTGGCGHRRVRTALGPAPPLLRPPLHLGLTWLAPSARSAQRPGGRCTRCPAPGHSRSLSAEGLAAVTCTGSGLRHPLPLRGLGPPASPPRPPPPLPVMPPVAWPLLVGAAGPSLPLTHSRSLSGLGGSRGSGRSQPGPGPGCRGSRAAPPGMWAAGPPAPPRPGTGFGPRPQGPSGSLHPGARPVRARCSRSLAHPCGGRTHAGGCPPCPSPGPAPPRTPSPVGQQTGPGLVLLGGPYGFPALCLLSTMRREPTSHLWKFCGAGFGVKVKEPELWMLVAKEYRYDHAAAHCWEYGFPEGLAGGEGLISPGA